MVFFINLILSIHYEKTEKGGFDLKEETLSESDVYISPNDLVTVTKAGSIVEVQHMKKMNTEMTIKKINKNQYVELSTGEVKEFSHTDNRSESYKSLRRTFKNIRYIINENFSGAPNELFFTLTYAENMQDNKRLYKDLDKFMKRIRYQYAGQTSIDYMSIVEPQARGAWHVHMLLKFNDLKTIFVQNKLLAEIWSFGFVKVKRLNKVDDIGAYLSAYLSDVELSDDTYLVGLKENRKLIEKEVDGQTKKFIKGGRLHLYPTGMNIFRKSKGIRIPERKRMSYKNAKKIVGSTKPHYSKKYDIENDEFENTIQFEQYNLKRL